MFSLERALAPLFPSWALRRVVARNTFDAVVRAYEGAGMGRRMQGWRSGNLSANEETRVSIETLRNRSRDLVRNNPYAAGGLDVLISYQVGCGIIPRSATGDRALDKQADEAFAAWSMACDRAGVLDFHGLLAQAARSRAEAGEALVRKVRLTATEARMRGAAVPLALQVLEPDFLDTAKNETTAAGTIKQGVEIDAADRRLAYWIFSDHPGEVIGSRMRRTSMRVPASDLLHVYRADRAGQVRGVPDLAPVMKRLRMLDDYEDATFEQARVQACLAAFVTSSAGAGKGPLEGAVEAESGQQRRTLAPGIIERLRPGEDVKFLSPGGSGGFSDFAKHQLRAVAMGFGLTYDLLTADLAEANYSSLRAGRLAFRRRLEQAQWLMLVPMLCQPIWDAWIEAAQVAGVLPDRAGKWPVKWSPPRFEFVDPEKDARATVALVRSGLMTWGQAVAEQGWDPRAQVDEIAEWNMALSDKGIILDSDPRRTNGSGGAQDAKQNAVVEIAAEGAAGPPAADPAPAP